MVRPVAEWVRPRGIQYSSNTPPSVPAAEKLTSCDPPTPGAYGYAMRAVAGLLLALVPLAKLEAVTHSHADLGNPRIITEIALKWTLALW